MQNTIITINIGKTDKPIIEYKQIVKSNNSKIITSNDNNKPELWID